MPPIDTAKGWVRLYELKTGKGYKPGEHPFTQKITGGGKQLVGAFREIADEIGADKLASKTSTMPVKNMSDIQ